MVISFEAGTKKSDILLLRCEPIMFSNWPEMPINGMAVMNVDVSFSLQPVMSRKGIILGKNTTGTSCCDEALQLLGFPG